MTKGDLEQAYRDAVLQLKAAQICEARAADDHNAARDKADLAARNVNVARHNLLEEITTGSVEVIRHNA